VGLRLALPVHGVTAPGMGQETAGRRSSGFPSPAAEVPGDPQACCQHHREGGQGLQGFPSRFPQRPIEEAPFVNHAEHPALQPTQRRDMSREGAGACFHIPGFIGSFRKRDGHHRQALEGKAIGFIEVMHRMNLHGRTGRQIGMLAGQCRGMAGDPVGITSPLTASR